MVQLLKYKSNVIDQAKQKKIGELHGTMTNRDLASEIGVNYVDLKNYLSKLALPSRYRERKILPFEERPVRLVLSGIKQKHYTEAFKAASKAVEQFKCKRKRKKK